MDLAIDAPLAVQTSPLFYYPPIESTAVCIEYLGVEYVLPWLDTSRDPNIKNLDDLKNSAIPIQHNPAEGEIWQRSAFISYGVYAQIRQLNGETDFPMVKMVSRHADAREHIQNEFRLLRLLSETKSVVQVHAAALVDDQGIFGFRMEKLNEMLAEDRPRYMSQIKEAVEDIHRAGLVHCDLSFSNIMVKDRQVRLIDFGLSGNFGGTIPKHHLQRKFFKMDTFSKSIDDRKLEKLMQMATQE